MKKDKLNWKEVWKSPFWYDQGGYVWSKDNVMTFSAAVDLNERACDEVCLAVTAVLNGETPGKKYPNLEVKYGCDLFDGETMIGSVRGWSHLTATLKLDMQEAEEVQDGLIKFIVEQLRDEEVNSKEE